MLTAEEIRTTQLKGLKAKHIPYEFTDKGWEKNHENIEDVKLLQYFFYPFEKFGLFVEGILFVRENFTLGKDKVDSFLVDLENQ